MASETQETQIRLRGDLHCHTNASDGRHGIDEMERAAWGLGHEYLAITDHSPRLTVANGLGRDRLHQQWEWVDALAGGTRVLRGIEVDILRDGALDQAPDLLSGTDVVVASVHTGLDSDSASLTRRMVAAAANPHTLVLGHCTGRRRRTDGTWRPQSRFDAEVVFAACEMFGVAVEINARPDRDDPPDDLVLLALEMGCLFAIDSDAHSVEQLAFVERGVLRAERLGIPPERVINSWSADALLAHARRRRPFRR